jgi:glutathione S-transferase
MVVLFDLATRSDSRPSPFCWRAKLALRHKQLPFEARATLYSEISSLGDGSFKTLPVIEDDGVWSGGSFNIAIDLESRYPDRPTLFPNDPRRLLAEFVESWVDLTLHPQIFPSVALKIWEQLPSSEQEYFRCTRERRLSMTLEEAHERSISNRPAIRASLDPMRRILERRAFLAGERPAYADYIVYGALNWYRLSLEDPLIEASDPIAVWFDRVPMAT